MKIRLFYISLGICLGSALKPAFSQHLSTLKAPVFKKDTINVLKTGAIADGITLNTNSINKAIEGLSKRGGGVVLIPKGVWSSGPIVLKSNINLHLAEGALLVFSDDFDQYPLVEGNWEGLPQMRNQSPISAAQQQNIAITGKGIIDGNGQAWRPVKKEKLTEGQWKQLIAEGGVLTADKKMWYPSASSLKGSIEKNPGVMDGKKSAAYYATVKDFLRPNMVLFNQCKNIYLQGVTFQNSPAWCLHPLMSENIVVRDIKVKNPWFAQNGDGIDLESCTNVLIENSFFDVGDDALCMKSGRDEAGRKRGMPTQQVTIRNSTVYSAHGGFVIGSEMSGGVKNIQVNNCSFIGTDIGLRFKTARGRGGVVENIDISDIQMKNIPGEAILFDMYYMAKDPVPQFGEKQEMPTIEKKPLDETTPSFRNFKIRNVTCDGAAKAIFIRGLPEMAIHHLELTNMHFKSDKGIELQEAQNIVLKDIDLNITDPSKPVVAVDTSKISLKGVTTYQHSSRSLSQLVSMTAMSLWPDSFKLPNDKNIKWHYDQGVILKGIEEVWKVTGEKEWFQYIQKSMDFYVNEEGNIRAYKSSDYNIDNVNNGKVLMTLYQVTGKIKYLKALQQLRDQMKTHPRTNQGGYWHKKVYPNQMWLDGLYMAQPFLAEYAQVFHEDSLYDDIVRQFEWMEKNARDPKTGLLYHGWDESRKQKWADPKTGTSAHFWGRSLGWFGMALVDALEFFPPSHPGRSSMLGILDRFVAAVTAFQDPQTGLWYDIVNLKDRKPNYPESSASAMLTYTIAKGVRLGYLPASSLSSAQKAYNGMREHFIEDANGRVNLKSTVTVSGLGGEPYRDGSFEYYMSEPVITNDPKGLGAFILCAAEMEKHALPQQAKGKQILLDNFYNNELRKDARGVDQSWHYVWNERDNNGYSFLQDIFQRNGASTHTLKTRPTLQTLSKADVYIIVDPDTERESTNPNFIAKEDIDVLKSWVNNGGTLVLLGNDSINAEFQHFNALSDAFGIQFEQTLVNPVLKEKFEMGEVRTGNGNPIFQKNYKLFIKELSPLRLTGNAQSMVEKEGKSIMAIVQYGKGRVFALGDPWVYNEYVDGRKLPSEYENFKAAEDWVKWLLKIND
ncbi:MAG: hypothetical protein RL282_1443 [Bacteroidota bacterium]